jgi:hypothetical protein
MGGRAGTAASMRMELHLAARLGQEREYSLVGYDEED